MNRIKTATCCLLICYVGIANAQNDYSQREKHPVEAIQNVPKDTTVVTYEVKIKVQKFEDLLAEIVKKNQIVDGTVMVSSDTMTHVLSLSVDTIKVFFKNFEEQLNKEGYILLAPEKKAVEPDEAIPPSPAEKYDPRIDKFLNLEDTTIFTSSFVKYDTLIIHPSRRNYYKVVQIIHDFGEKLDSIVNKLSDTKINELARTAGASPEKARNLILDVAKEDIGEAELYLDGLLPFGKELDALSPSQRQYYKDLKDKYNELWKEINRE